MPYTVLIVDDSKLARMSVAKLLSALRPDWARVEAANADEAIAAATPGAVDVVLLDFNMPGRDGLELAGDLRRLYPSMPIAVVSANSQQEVTARVRAIGAAFLPKPVSEGDLRAFFDDAEQKLGSAGE
jgi:CheY-like chemotaxis protein